MINELTKRLILVLSLSLHACSASAENAYKCPGEISANTKILDLPDKWDAQAGDMRHFLTSATFSDGHPSELGFLRPSNVIKNKDSDVDVAIYDMLYISDEGAWLVCQYGNTAATLIKPLSKPYSECKVSLPKDSLQQEIVCVD